MKKIIEVLKGITPLTNEDINSFLEILSTITVNKGEYWIEAGKKNDDVAFVNEGYLRKFYVKDGKEITDFFYLENTFSADLPSIIGDLPPHANIIAMERATLITFSYNDFNALSKKSHALEHLHRVLIEATFLRFYKRTISFIMQSPKERYNELIVTNPEIIQRAAQYHIASYLGITAQHLSRLRAES